LFVGFLGWYPLTAAIRATHIAITGRKIPAPKNTGATRKTRTNGYVGAEIDDGGDWDD